MMCNSAKLQHPNKVQEESKPCENEVVAAADAPMDEKQETQNGTENKAANSKAKETTADDLAAERNGKSQTEIVEILCRRISFLGALTEWEGEEVLKNLKSISQLYTKYSKWRGVLATTLLEQSFAGM
jgi:hypothetical protein